jgi:hypothetical protein
MYYFHYTDEVTESQVSEEFHKVTMLEGDST